jgi:hypothetical protein
MLNIAGRHARPLALAVVAASLASLWRVVPDNAELRFTGETITAFARDHPPKPWHGFKTEVVKVAIDGEVRITAHVSGHFIHTPVEIIGLPEYNAERKAMFFHISRIQLPNEARHPIFSRFNKMLNPLGTNIVRHMMNVIPVRKFKPNTRSGLIFLTTVKSVRVDGDVVVVALHSFRVAGVAVALMLTAFLAAGLALLHRPSRQKPAA